MERNGLRFETFFPIKGVKSPRKIKVIFLANFALPAGFFLASVLLSALVERCFVPRMRYFFTKSFFCQNP